MKKDNPEGIWYEAWGGLFPIISSRDTFIKIAGKEHRVKSFQYDFDTPGFNPEVKIYLEES